MNPRAAHRRRDRRLPRAGAAGADVDAASSSRVIPGHRSRGSRRAMRRCRPPRAESGLRLRALYREDRRRAPAGRIVAGVDEVGRGPLAGPVFAGAVILGQRTPDRRPRRQQAPDPRGARGARCRDSRPGYRGGRRGSDRRRNRPVQYPRCLAAGDAPGGGCARPRAAVSPGGRSRAAAGARTRTRPSCGEMRSAPRSRRPPSSPRSPATA